MDLEKHYELSFVCTLVVPTVSYSTERELSFPALQPQQYGLPFGFRFYICMPSLCKYQIAAFYSMKVTCLLYSLTKINEASNFFYKQSGNTGSRADKGHPC
jgi:hypothetical protein